MLIDSDSDDSHGDDCVGCSGDNGGVLMTVIVMTVMVMMVSVVVEIMVVC